MAKKFTFLLIGIALFLGAWLFLGLDRYVGDHEVGSGWNLFIKAKPTFQLIFKNPAQYTLDRDSFDSLDHARKIQFLEYCGIRHRIRDPYLCEEYIEGIRIK
ncbi:hypothetical protein [Paracidovorax sp. MALMAid1276]|uniref:hypothetical protein n=1 Tax=Paracidovorax sp. MALMAid1276 TaxID=3411631 RepID=UPI003B9AECD6